MISQNLTMSLRTTGRVLAGQSSREELTGLGRRHLPLGLLCTWLVGVGRHWDNPRLSWLQHLGFGSVVYVFGLAALLWAVVAPFRPDRWSYENVLTFVTLTAPPAILYAVPVERFLPAETAALTNVWFLTVAAIWRVALLVWFLRRRAAFSPGKVVVIALLPLTFLVTTLTALNLDRVVFDFMGGNSGPPDPNAGAYTVLLILTLLSTWTFLPLLIAYGVLVVRARRKRVAQQGEESITTTDDS